MKTEEFLDLLEGVTRTSNGFDAICPTHEDNTASLGVTETETSILIRCRAGCETADVLSAMGLTFSDLFFNAVNFTEPEAIYDYVNEQGEVLFQAVRFPPKRFRQRHYAPDDPAAREDGYIWNLDGVRRVIYRLPEVLQAIREGRWVVICEGEKDVEALRALGRTATCNPMGAGKWRDEYTEFFRGANVIIIADRDEPGRAHAETVRDALTGVAKVIYVLQAKVGKDVSDHLAAGLGIEDFVPVRHRVRRGVLTARELADQALEDLEMTQIDIPGYLLSEAIPLVFRQGRMYAFGGYTGDGKSTLGIQGTRRWCMEGKHVTYFTLEMPERDLRNVLLAHKGIPLRALEEPWQIKANPEWNRIFHEGVEEIGGWNLDIVFESHMTADKVAEIARDRESDIVVIDHIHRFAWGIERRKFEDEVSKLTNLALEQNIMLVILCQLREPRLAGKDIEVYPRPTLQSFRESGVIGQDASMALAIWRQRDASGIRYVGPTEIILLKNRHTTGPFDATGQSWFVQYDYQTRTVVRKVIQEGS